MQATSRRRVIRRQPARLLALTGLGVLIAVFFASAAASGQATQFSVSAPSTTTAGTQFLVTVTARDANSIDKSYKGAHTLTFSGASNAPDFTPPSYPVHASVSFDQGQASVPVTLFNAAATTLFVSEDNTTPTIAGSSGNIAVAHGVPADLEFTAQPPVWTAKNSPFTAAVRVKDAYGNLGTNEPVSVTLNKNPTALSCTPSCTVTSDGSSAIASFSPSVSQDTVGYRLVATAVAALLRIAMSSRSATRSAISATGTGPRCRRPEHDADVHERHRGGRQRAWPFVDASVNLPATPLRCAAASRRRSARGRCSRGLILETTRFSRHGPSPRR